MSDLEKAVASAFAGQAVAIVGASERVHYHRALVNNLEAVGPPVGGIYLVNPKRDAVFERPCYPSVLAVPAPLDTAVIATPAHTVADLVEECGTAGIRNVAVVSNGFAESGPEGRDRQAALREVAKRYGIAVIGPSSLGLMSYSTGFGLLAAPIPAALKPGSVSLVFQSGGMLNLFLTLMAERRVGLASAVVTGNEATLTVADFLRRAVDDPATSVIAVYVESIRDPATFTAALAAAEQAGKPVIVLRAGTSPRGMRNVTTHSGNLASASMSWSGLFRQRNVIAVGNLGAFIESVVAVDAAERLRIRPANRRACLMSVSGGDCTLLADLADQAGWELPDLASADHQELMTLMGKVTAADNPLDVGGLWRKGLIGDVARLVAERADVSVVGFRLNLPASPEPGLLDAYRVLAGSVRASGKLPVALTRASERIAEHWYDFFASIDVPLLHEYASALATLSGLTRHYEWRLRRAEAFAEPVPSPGAPAREIVSWFGELPPGQLTFEESAHLLKAYGISSVRSRVVTRVDDAVEAARDIGFPVVLKVDSRQVAHRTEIGAVRIGLSDEDAVTQAFAEIEAAALTAGADEQEVAVVVQEMASAAAEFLVGVHRDPEMGPVVLAGLGGIFVELLGDVALRPAPVDSSDVDDMLGELRGRVVLSGARGKAPADVAAIRDVVLAVSRLVGDLGSALGELDINPLMVFADGHGAQVADALVVRADPVSEAAGPEAERPEEMR